MGDTEYSKGLAKRIVRLVETFPDSFGHIDPEHVLPLKSHKGSSRAIADVRQIPQWMHCMVPWRVCMTTYLVHFETMSKNVKDLVVVHELEHIASYDSETDKYKLKTHEVEDWMDMVALLGPGWHKSTRVDISSTSELNWREALATATRHRKRKPRTP